MAKARVNRIAKNPMRKLFQKYKIRECFVKVIRLEDVIQEKQKLQKALLKEHGIRECKVTLNRLDKPLTQTPKRKLILKPDTSVTVRSNVAWLPKISKNKEKRVSFATKFCDQEKAQKDTENLRIRPMKRTRAVSMFEERSINGNDLKPSLADFHREILEKRNHLSPVGMRKIQPKIHQDVIPDWIQIRDEFQKKLYAKPTG